MTAAVRPRKVAPSRSPRPARCQATPTQVVANTMPRPTPRPGGTRPRSVTARMRKAPPTITRLCPTCATTGARLLMSGRTEASASGSLAALTIAAGVGSAAVS